ncbi:TlpA disulfide reductase family protein [Thiomicrospira sp. ALE5]|uniref:TlpA disulfide reductase family protein n=1 Tax=Thiomicrospira sp. ALE5 TaxID=748650 RepID=UPI0008ED5FED|nr:TlpA disulfide reductase family protein [Thiomicrospira sp. ALE5]SFR53530.1 Peroxiredoxin [Thiomicrospira sp. ALE5]
MILNLSHRLAGLLFKPATKNKLVLCFLLGLVSLAALSNPAQAMPAPLADWSASQQIDIHYVAASAPRQGQLLWLPSEYGRLDSELELAQTLAEQGFDSIMPDFFNSLMQAASRDNFSQIAPEYWISLIQTSHQLTPNSLPTWIIAPNRAAAAALQALAHYQQTAQSQLGLILINPDLFIATPEPGQVAEYLPAVSATNLPIYILQAELSPWRWQLTELVQQLEQSGSESYIHLLAGLRDRFYFRPDATAFEQQATQQLGQQILRASQLLFPLMQTARQSAPVASLAATSEQKLTNSAALATAETTTARLQLYRGEQGRDFNLVDLDGQTHRLSDYKGQVVLLNFWASWCPPCLYEMPSMARLKNQFSDADFEILAVNLAERPEDFAQFLADNPVNFPILLDPAGSAIQTWRILAYPTTYLIDRQGQLRYALIGGIEWDEPEPVAAVKRLLSE